MTSWQKLRDTPPTGRLLERETARGATIVHIAGFGVFVLVLAGIRLATGPWYHLYNPVDSRLLSGWPVEWEAYYFLPHFSSFVGNGPPFDGLAPVHLRVLIPMAVSAVLASVTGSAFWSVAIVDLLGWTAAPVAVFTIARLGRLSNHVALMSGVAVAASPLFISQMWMHVFHLVEFASLPVGLLVGMGIVSRAYRAIVGETSLAGVVLRFAGMLVLLRYFYVYQAIVALLLATDVLRRATSQFQEDRRLLRAMQAGTTALGLLGGGMLLAQLVTAVIDGILTTAGLAPHGYLDAVAEPTTLVLAFAAGGLSGSVRLVWEALDGALRLMSASFNPFVLCAGFLGISLSGSRLAVLGCALVVITIIATIVYPAPWTAMTAYPFVYIGVGVVCDWLGRLVGRSVEDVAVRARWSIGDPMQWIVKVVSWSGLFLVVALTNGDLWGDTRFAIAWWQSYAHVPRY
jgi:hypothetical protein